MDGAIKEIPIWGAFILSGGLAGITAIIVARWVVPWQRRAVVSNIRRLRAQTAVPLICAMNCKYILTITLSVMHPRVQSLIHAKIN